MKTVAPALLCALALAGPTNALAQEDATERTRRILAESEAHHEAGREALAAEGYLRAYEALRELGRRGAPIALWNAGNALADVPGRERDAIVTLRRFLDESTILTNEPQVVEWRSTAVGLIAELEARAPQSSGQDLGEPDGASSDPPPPTTGREGGSISPIGPILLGVGGAAIVAGVIMGAVALGQDANQVERCPMQTGCAEELRADVDQTRTLAAAGDGLWIGGALVAATGLVLTLVLQTNSEDGGSTVAFVAVPGGGSVRLQGRFQ